MFPFVYEINAAGWFHLIYFGLVIPYLAVSRARKFKDRTQPLPNRVRHFQRIAATLVMFGAFSLLVARAEWMDLFPRAMPAWRAIVAGALMLIATIAFMRPKWRAAVERRERVVYLFMPANTSERIWWIAVAVLAGISEEITWRGVQAGLAANLTQSIWAAFLICSISFAVGHAVQGWRSIAVVLAFALGFHFLVWLSGSLYVAMAVHVAYDTIAGISYGRLGKELGYTLEPAATQTNEAGS
jgi:membrane protease YdiL (CAAX protease family)